MGEEPATTTTTTGRRSGERPPMNLAQLLGATTRVPVPVVRHRTGVERAADSAGQITRLVMSLAVIFAIAMGCYELYRVVTG